MPQRDGERVPLFDLAAEASVLSAVMQQPDAWESLVELLPGEEMFYQPAHRELYRALVTLRDAGEPFGMVQITNALRNAHSLERAGGTGYLAEIYDYTYTAANLAADAKIVREKHRLRRLHAIGCEVAALAETGKPVAEVQEEAERLVYAAGEGLQVDAPLRHIKAGLLATLERLEKNEPDVLTGFADYDRMSNGFARGDLVILAARPSMGKAQPLDAQVLTPRGFVPMWSIRTGSQVIGADGKPHAVTGVYPQGEKQVYRVTFSDGAATECCDEHLWFTTTVRERKRGEAGSVKSLKEIRETLEYPGAQPRPNHWIPWVEPVEFEGSALPLPPYLLGLYLGDGYSGGATMRLCNPEPDVQRRFAGLLEDGDDLSVAVDGMTCTVRRVKRTNRAARTKMVLDALGLSGLRSEEKFVPQPYLFASPSERLELLRGLFDTDGYVYPTGVGVEYTTVSPRLAQAVRFLALSLGGRVTTHEKRPTFVHNGERREGQLAYRMNVSFDNGLVPVSSEKHIARWQLRTRNSMRRIISVEPAGVKPCQCIRIDSPDHLYVTDEFIVTHNTALMLQMAVNVAIREKKPVPVFSLEMSEEAIAKRLLFCESRVNQAEYRRNCMDPDLNRRLHDAVCLLNQAPVFTHSTARTAREVRAQCRRLVAQHGPLGLIAIDYLGKMRGSGQTEKRVHELGEITGDLKAIAVEFDVPVLLLSQLSRAVEARPDKRPMMSDLRDSGEIEQDADTVLLLYRPEYYFGPTTKVGEGKGKGEVVSIEGKAELLVAKQRNGETGTVHLRFYKEFTRFESISGREERR